MSQTASDYVIRFFGRFVLAFPRNREARKTSLTVLAIDMNFNKALKFPRHCPTLTAPKALILEDSKPNDLSLMTTEFEHDRLKELAVWNLDRSEMSCGGVANPSITWDNQSFLPDLGPLSGGGALNQANLNPLAGPGPVAFSFTIHGGSVRPMQLEPTTYDFVEFGNTKKVRSKGDQKIADGVAIFVTLQKDKPLTFDIRTGGGAKSSIRFARRALAGAHAKVLTFANLCGDPDTRVDKEFAAFYEILHTPPVPKRRLIPKARPTEGIDASCFPQAQISF